MRLGEDEFWALTMRELNALIKRDKNNHEWLNYRSALICSVMANAWLKPKNTPYTPQDFMPVQESKTQNPDQIFNTISLINAAAGGTVVEV